MSEKCELCGSKNIVWFVDSALWNKYSNGHNIICVNCFVELAESKGFLPTAWELVPENSPKLEDNSKPTQNNSTPKLPEYERFRVLVNRWYLARVSNGEVLGWSLARRMYEFIIAGNIGDA